MAKAGESRFFSRRSKTDPRYSLKPELLEPSPLIYEAQTTRPPTNTGSGIVQTALHQGSSQLTRSPKPKSPFPFHHAYGTPPSATGSNSGRHRVSGMSPERSAAPTLKKRKKVLDAYAFGAPDEDEEWSTLPSKKKAKTCPDRSSVSTASFFIPGLVGPALPGAKKSGMSATSERRVITFLPPPLHPPADSEATKEIQQVCSPADNGSPEPPLSGPWPRESGPNRRSSPTRPIERPYPHNPLPSPPTSDDRLTTLVSPKSEEELNPFAHATFEASQLKERYSQIRNTIKMRKAKAKEAFNVLGFESCGVVFRDEWKGDGEEFGSQEIRMLNFP
ncbi:hypothetical protein DFP72DRAFT_1071687 [Ephemerocybe angulata]|uniref:Uncharacterized protein n=1 Tax=Ephemerocybe angulata TaxID=980116 RepID=A0A8H6M3S2_9AGAR|nr:hypothetical protein DFP72DRAFT_1071687 [Tulosesus angulatus]